MSTSPYPSYTPARLRWLKAGILTSMAAASLESTIVATAMPSIVSELGGFDLFSWVFAIFLLGQAVTIPICGRLADLYGRKPVYAIGMALFLGGSLLCGMAHSMLALVIFRAIQGLGAGGVMPMTVTIIADIFTPDQRARFQGYMSTVWGMSAIGGPIVGAFIVSQANWAWIFWLNIPFGLAALVAILVTLHERKSPRAQRIDLAASVLLVVGLGAVMLALVQWTQFAWLTRILLIGGGGAALVILILHERTSPQPVLPIELWRMRTIAIANCAVLVIAAVTMAVTAFLPTYVHAVFGGNPLVAGMSLGAMLVAWPIAGALGPYLSLRTSFRHVAMLGAVILAIGGILLAALDAAHGPIYAMLAAGVIGFGVGFSNNNYMLSAQVSVAHNQRGLASSTNMFTRIVGTAVGAALFGGVLNFELARRLPGMSEGMVEKLLEPHTRDAVLASADAGLIGEIAASIHSVFLLSAILSVSVFAFAWNMPRGLNLRSPSPGSSS